MKAADLLLVSSNDDWEARLIHWGTHSHWNHIAIYVMTDAGMALVEATRKGIAIAPIDKYKDAETIRIDTKLTDAERERANAFALSTVGQRYGFGQIAAIALAWLTHGHIFFGSDRTEICSSLAGRIIEHGGVILPRSPELTRPTDFAFLFDITPRLEEA